VFKAWFLEGLITGGDFWPYYNSMYSQYPLSLSAWYFNFNAGLGGFSGPFLWIFLNVGLPITFLGKTFGLSWSMIERIYYLFPLLAISIASSSLLYTKTIAKNNYSILASFIFVFNTYFLMVVGGGQVLGVGLAYAVLPLALSIFVDISNASKINFKKLLTLGLVLAIQAIFDIRISYITIFAFFIYFFMLRQFNKQKKYLLSLFVPLCVLLLLNLFWILPTAVVHQNPFDNLGSAYNSINAVKFFSFAKLENTISLLQPNWPENIFGKVSFMKPEFLLLPILAFGSLLFLEKETKERKMHILFFSLLGLIGAFLAKGAQDPFGGVYLWMFEHIPGFVMFRDPTKWYTLIAISYSILIPYSISKIYAWLKSLSKFSIKSKIFNIQNIFLLFVLGFMLFLIRPALLGQLGGTFKSVEIPSEYVKLEKLLSHDNRFYRTIWVPQIQRFAFFTNNHPAISANDLFKVNSPKEDVNFLNKKEALKTLEESSVKYVIIPYDSMGEIFLTDRKYDDKVYAKTINDLSYVSWLKKIEGFGRITVYEVSNSKDHFWSPESNMKISYKYINPTRYIVNLKNAQKDDRLVFAENYDPGWILSSSKFKVQSSKFDEKFNSFSLPNNGNYSLEIYYQPQKWVDIGSMISLISLLAVFGCLVFIYRRRVKS